MVLSGSATTTFTNNSAFSLVLSWTATQNVSANTSSVTATLKLKANSYYSEASGWNNKTAVININGTSESKSVNVNISPGDDPKTLFTKTVTVAHSADGSKSFNISASVDYTGVTWHSGKLGKISVSGSYALNTIPRATVPYVSPTTCNMDSAFKVTLPRASADFTHTVTLAFGSKTVTLSSAATTSLSYTPKTSDFAAQIPDDLNGKGTITVVTKNGSTTIGTKTISIYLQIPSTVKPTISSITLVDKNATVNSVAGATVYLQKLSQFAFTVNSPAASTGSSIEQVSLSFNGQTYIGSTATISNVNKSGTLTCTATVLDSRGLSVSKSLSVTVTAYRPPAITVANTQRTASGTGTSFTLSRTGTFTSLAEKNKVTILFQYKTSKTATAWTTMTSLTKANYSNTAGTFTYSNEASDATVFSKLISYPWQVVVTDTLGQTATAGGTLTTAEVAMSWSKSGVGIGKIWEQGSLDLANDIYIGGYARILASEASGSSGNTDIEAAPDKNISLGARSTGLINFYRPTVFKQAMASNLDMGGYRLTAPRIDVHPTWTTWQVNETNINGLPTLYMSNSNGGRFGFEPIAANAKTVANFYIGSDGSSRIWADTGLYDRTYSNAANMVVTSSGTVGRSTSASKYKLSIAEIPDSSQLSSNLLTVKPKSWFDKRQIENLADEMTEGVTTSEDSLKATKYFGLIAEDLRDAGLQDYLSYDDKTGEIEGIAYDRLWTLLIPSIRKHEEELAEQKSINLNLELALKKLQEA